MQHEYHAEQASSFLYFFLSYARTPQLDPSGNLDPDWWVYKLYQDLCTEISHLTGMPSESVGFMDREAIVRVNWSSGLAEALSNCRVFVPLYSPDYFKNDKCGKEWSVFARRVLQQKALGSGMVEIIVPVLWRPVQPDDLPDVARQIEFDHQVFGKRYADMGFYGIMKLTRYKEDYQRAINGLASRIVQAAEQSTIPASHLVEYSTLQSAFGHGSHGQRRRVRHQIQITIAAPDRSSLPQGRSEDFYGPTAREWCPYLPVYQQPLADYAAELTSTLSPCEPHVTTLDEWIASGAGDEQLAPGLFLVDPWATMSVVHFQGLQRFDELDQPWVSVLVPWNSQDRETVGSGEELRNSLAHCLPRKLANVPRGCEIAAKGVPTLTEFGGLLLRMIALMVDRFCKKGPHKGPSVERPRISAADPRE
jgi:FxsC-like protein